MENTLLKSKLIDNLKRQLLAGNCSSVKKFWAELERIGAPLIEKIDNDPENFLITYIYKGNEDTKNVALIPPAKFENNLENQLEKLPTTNLWYKTYKIKNDLRFSYSFSVNDTSHDRCKNLKYDPLNKNKLIFKGDEWDDEEIISYVVMPNASPQNWIKEIKTNPKGNLYDHKFYSEKLNNYRNIWIYTPHNYSKNTEPYGVLLLTDGNEYIDILSATTVLDNLIYDKIIPPIITIFIETNKDRSKELMCNDDFARFLSYDILPWVRKEYNITTTPSKTIIGGLSLGGLTASYVALKHSDIFGNVLSQSGSYWWKPEGYNQTDWLATQFNLIDKLSIKFYINVGALETKDKMIDTNITLKDTLIKKGYNVYFEEFDSGHDYLCWGQTLANGLIYLIGK